MEIVIAGIATGIIALAIVYVIIFTNDMDLYDKTHKDE